MAGSTERDAPHTGGRVLIVDDSPVVRQLLGDMLRRAGYEVREASAGQDALDCLDRDAYDAVVTDLRMPGLDGFGLLEAVKGRSLATEVVILAGDASQDVASAVRALRLGAHDFLTKPPTRADEVVLTVERAVEKKRLKEANARLVRELETLSLTDALTGALNRRAFDENLRRETSRATRYHLSLSVVILDLDHFKGINDRHGHQAGDEVLRRFARLASATFRESDAVHRVGGEEFAVILPHTPVEGALQAVRRFLQTFAATAVPWNGLAITATVSAGICGGTGSELKGADLVALADRALYQAKQDGRNRAMVAARPAPGEGAGGDVLGACPGNQGTRS